MTLLADVVGCLEQLYDPRAAEDWDAVGLVCGEPNAEVAAIVFAVDPVEAVIDEAIALGADLVVTHHPLLLRPVHSVAATTPKGVVVQRLIRAGCALHVVHTNADSASPGVSDALAAALGVTDLRPLVPQDSDALDKLVTFVPTGQADSVIDALAGAGAGRLGDYDRCAWTTGGVGTFRPGERARPAIGRVGHVEQVEETRIEMVLPRRLRSDVVVALRDAHPYEEPAFDVLELAPWPGPRGLGRVGRLPEPVTLTEFVDLVATALPATAGGVRASGPPDRLVQRVAVCGGAGDSLIPAARAAGADVFVTADLRHHVAAEALQAGSSGSGRPPMALVDVSHWASEWPWLGDCADRLAAALATMTGTAGPSVTMHVSRACTDPWTLHVRSPINEGSAS